MRARWASEPQSTNSTALYSGRDLGENGAFSRLQVATANVCTLLHGDSQEKAEKGVGLRAAGRTATLERAFDKFKLDLVGVQESRLRGDGDKQAVKFRIVSSSANADGCFGVQLWIRISSRIKVKWAQPISPRLLLTMVVWKGMTILVVVAHAPHEVTNMINKAKADNFWDELREKTAAQLQTEKADGMIMLIDANAKLGRYSNKFVGGKRSQHREPQRVAAA